MRQSATNPPQLADAPAESAAIPNAGKPRTARRLQKLAFFLLIVAFLEGTAWVADSFLHYRHRLLAAYARMQPMNAPVHADDFKTADTNLFVRVDQRPPLFPTPHVVGGRTIPNAIVVNSAVPIRPQSLESLPPRRIFIVGGSAAFGFPYGYRETLAGQLDAVLRADGGLVINAAKVGASSGELVSVVQQIVDFYHPEALILFLGNNEWINWEPQGQSTINPEILSALRLIAHSRLFAAAQFLTVGMGDHRPGHFSSGGEFASHYELEGYAYALKHPSDAAAFDPGSWLETKPQYLNAFQHNLRQMIRLAQEKNVRVILLTVPFNYKLSPAWKHPQPEAFDLKHAPEVRVSIQTAASLLEERRFEESLQQIERTLALDPRPPLLHYLKARCLEALDRPLEAEEAYARCREEMVGNLGSRLSINKCIRDVAAETGAGLVDVRELFDEYEHARERYFNVDLIHDDCHPTPLGHRLIADALAALLKQKHD